MEYTNEFLARVYGAYIGCKVRDDLSNEFPKLMGFTQSPSCEKENGTNEDAGWVEVRFEGEWKNRGRGFNQVTLHLTPLSEISDEDAIEVAKILLGKADGFEDIAVERNEYYVNMVIKKEPDIINPETTIEMCVMIWLNDTSNPVRWVWNYIKGNGTGINDRACPNVIAIYDYLRRKGYMLPYERVDLFEAGIAIKKQQP